jgi:hypothetical protein
LLVCSVDSGPCGGPCATAPDGSLAKKLDGGNGQVCCRWPEAVVKSWSMAATWESDPALLGRKLQIMIAGNPAVTTTVTVRDTCSDTDCNGCCSSSTGSGAQKLIDIEKWPASALLGYSSSSPTFDINNVVYPTAASTGYARPGAPQDSVMPLCYKDAGPVPW